MDLRLMLMRHAEAEESFNKHDENRILTQNGKKQAEQAASFLHNLQIDKILVSYAKRAMQTETIITKNIEINKTEIISELYEKDEEIDILNIITMQENDDKHILIIGHNPLIYSLGAYLSNSDSENYNTVIDSGMPNASVVIIEFKNIHEWQFITPHSGTIIQNFIPSKL